MIKVNTLPIKSISKIHLTQPFSQISEIRLRAAQPAVSVDVFGKMNICSPPFSADEIAEVFAEICRYSVYSYEEQIAQGFVTMDGGYRVGISGTVITKNGRITGFKDISGLNIRFARQIIGCAEELFGRVFKKKPQSLLLAGKPLSGKTTVLRDLARLLGKTHRVTVIDSRGEISAMTGGTPALDIGLNTDVICGAEKSEGIVLALRTLSPEYIICDEIGNDCAAVEQTMFCGVKLIASAHASSLSELKARSGISRLVPMFDAAAVLGECGRLAEFQITESENA